VGGVAELLALLALAAALAAAVVRDRRAPEAIVALGAAAVLVVTGVLSWHEARDEAGDLVSTLATLAGLLVLGLGCERAGVFAWLAEGIASGARGSATRLLALVFAAAATVTAVLGLDATVVLLTPAAFAAAARARVPGRPHVYACTHLANSASVLLPVSNPRTSSRSKRRTCRSRASRRSWSCRGRSRSRSSGSPIASPSAASSPSTRRRSRAGRRAPRARRSPSSPSRWSHSP
jgi:Citrate transporter